MLRCVTAGQLLRHYSPDLEVIRVVGATPASTKGRVRHTGGHADLVNMARWVVNRCAACLWLVLARSLSLTDEWKQVYIFFIITSI